MSVQNRELEKGDWGEIRQWQELSEGFSLEAEILPSGALPGLLPSSRIESRMQGWGLGRWPGA